MSSQTMAMSNLGEALMTLGLDEKEILSNKLVCLI